MKSQRNTITITCIFIAMIRSSTLKIQLLHFKIFAQNKHNTMHFIVHVLILLIPVSQLTCSCKEFKPCTKKADKEKRALIDGPSLLLLCSLFLV